MAIAIQNLWKTYIKDGNRIDALKGIDLDIAAAESLALVGVSGAGKSTLIHILGTLDRPTQGRVLYNGVDVFTWPEKRLAAFRNTRIGFVFQFHQLLPEFSGLENVMLPALIGGLAKREARKKAEGLLKDVGLGDRMTHKPGELSGGEQQRVAVARALIMAPDILLADEPTGNLDTETGKIIEDLLIDLHRERNVTLVVVTHNQSLAQRMSRSVGLRDGRIDPRA
ncbi:MAG: ABC transporter ATP-binding protein [Syntrophales bacterium]|jgi:lipoprotein-releasing system ATP-binding protein|nr:ABC transporter ATP-binding protein [Syntrophales bacterium]MDD4338154.1 ABC transporter ATP-binding protein [Syntrophales bacterium]HOG07181.1 ABC transporter ATP-binding protein [Syntrophales bacterium]HOS76506.1 ABC transporter ATP-binding protein [Syntrophales bacterium]HPB69330.1 ABC transporter ATP-binding protein [Syntrophales bacterium]